MSKTERMHGKHRCLPYYVLFVFDPDGFFVLEDGTSRRGQWTIEFGDYNRSTVKFEQQDLCTGWQDLPRRFTKIVDVCSCECSLPELREIADALERPNGF